MAHKQNEKQLNVDLSATLVDSLEKLAEKKGMKKKKLVGIYLRLGNQSEVKIPKFIKEMQEAIDKVQRKLKRKVEVIPKSMIEIDPITYNFDLFKEETGVLVMRCGDYE